MLKKEQTIKDRPFSLNILTTVRAKHDFRERPVVIFSAHYDSASVNYSERFLIYMSLIFFFFSFLYFLITYIVDVYFPVKLMSCVLVLVYLVFFLTIRINNTSNGSIDNASGTAILIELSKIFYNNPLTNLDIIFLWTGAEEMGLFGSKTYCYRNFKRLDKDYNLDKSYIINIDMVGSYIGLIDKVGIFEKTPLNRSLNNKLEERKLRIS